MKFSGIFLDRDGVIIQNRPNYVRSFKDVRFIPDTLRAIAKVSKTNYKIVIITNQSVVGRGIISIETALFINQKIVKKIHESGGRIDDVFMCPHSPEENCECRKPHPGLFMQAIEKFSIDPSSSVVVGDSLTDLLGANRSGIGRLFLVKTGRGKKQLELPWPDEIKSLKVFSNLSRALEQV